MLPQDLSVLYRIEYLLEVFLYVNFPLYNIVVCMTETEGWANKCYLEEF